MRLRNTLLLTLAMTSIAAMGCGAGEGPTDTPQAADAAPAPDAPPPFFDEEQMLIIGTLSSAEMTLPASPTNEFADSEDAALVGKMIFFDKQVSGMLMTDSHLGDMGQMGKVACVSCHVPGNFFTDILGGRTSVGAMRTERNAQTIVNAAFNEWVYPSGRSDSLWSQATGALLMDLNADVLKVVHLVNDKYKSEYEAAFGALDPALTAGAADASRFPAMATPMMWRMWAHNMAPGSTPMPAVVTANDMWNSMAPADQAIAARVFVNVGKSIEAYERSLTSFNAPFDQFVAGDEGAIEESAKRGLALFIKDAKCINCHKGPNFNDHKFYNIHLAQFPDGVSIPDVDLGRQSGINKILMSPFNVNSPFSDDQNTGKLAELVMDDTAEGTKWRPQSLRHVSLTAPYMHAGQFETLLEVMEFYNDGGHSEGVSGDAHESILELNLTDEDLQDLVAFMETLTGSALPAALTEDISK